MMGDLYKLTNQGTLGTLIRDSRLFTAQTATAEQVTPNAR